MWFQIKFADYAIYSPFLPNLLLIKPKNLSLSRNQFFMVKSGQNRQKITLLCSQNSTQAENMHVYSSFIIRNQSLCDEIRSSRKRKFRARGLVIDCKQFATKCLLGYFAMNFNKGFSHRIAKPGCTKLNPYTHKPISIKGLRPGWFWQTTAMSCSELNLRLWAIRTFHFIFCVYLFLSPTHKAKCTNCVFSRFFRKIGSFNVF